MVIYETALHPIKEGRVKLDSKTGNFVVDGKNSSHYVKLFPKRTCNCQTGEFGKKQRACQHINAALLSIGIKDASNKKPNVTETRRRRKPPKRKFRKRAGGKSPRIGDEVFKTEKLQHEN